LTKAGSEGCYLLTPDLLTFSRGRRRRPFLPLPGEIALSRCGAGTIVLLFLFLVDFCLDEAIVLLMKVFKRGNIREDGMVFNVYARKKDGSLSERWVTPEKLDEIRARDVVSQKRREVAGLRKHYRADPIKQRAACVRYRQANRDMIVERQRHIRELYPERHRSALKRYRERHPEKSAAMSKAWIKSNPERIRARRKAWAEKGGLLRRIGINSRQRVSRFLRGHVSCSGSFWIGCDNAELVVHLESQFKDGMSWENYGTRGWHVDHVVPLSSAKTLDDLARVLHYTNLQPLWAKENLSKGARVASSNASHEVKS
jgi:hypothetical protein